MVYVFGLLFSFHYYRQLVKGQLYPLPGPWFLRACNSLSKRKIWRKKKIQKYPIFLKVLSLFSTNGSHSLHLILGKGTKICAGKNRESLEKSMFNSMWVKKIFPKGKFICTPSTLATTFVLIFWQFTVFQYKLCFPQVKWDLIFDTTDSAYEFSNNLRLRILGN